LEHPVEITFRNMDRSDAIEARVRAGADKLEQFCDRIMSCRVVVERSHRHHHKGNVYHVRIDLTVPEDELVVSREPGENHAHEDAYVAVRDAFKAMRRQLEDYARRQRPQDLKRHEAPPHGRIKAVFREYGLIQTPDDREVLFRPGAVVDADYGSLNVGDEVRYTEVLGEDGPTATTVHVVGKHHIVG